MMMRQKKQTTRRTHLIQIKKHKSEGCFSYHDRPNQTQKRARYRLSVSGVIPR